MADLTPIDRMAVNLVPLLVEARELLKHEPVDEKIAAAFDALESAAQEVSYQLLRKSAWKDGRPARDLMHRIDETLAEMNAIYEGAS